MSDEWGKYLNARHALIHTYYKEGIPGYTGRATPEQIVQSLRMDPVQVQLIANTPLEKEPEDVASVERRHILSVYREESNNISKACKRLGIGRTTLYRRLRQYGLK